MSAIGQRFHYRAAMADGSLATGILEAANRNEALLQLQRLGGRPLRLETKPLTSSWLTRDIGGPGGKRLSIAEWARFCAEMALLLEGGLTIRESLQSVIVSSRRRSRLSRFAGAVQQSVQLGRG